METVDAKKLKTEFDVAGLTTPSEIESDESVLALHFNGSSIRATQFTLRMGNSGPVNWAAIDIIRKHVKPVPRLFADDLYRKCEVCEGEGQIYVQADDEYQQCPSCHGRCFLPLSIQEG